MTPCEAGFHPTLRHHPRADDGMGAWKCDDCGYILAITELQNQTCELLCEKLLEKAADPTNSGRFGFQPLNEIVDKMRCNNTAETQAINQQAARDLEDE